MRLHTMIAIWGVLALVAPLIVACAPLTSATTYKALPAKSSADEVEVFTDVRPDRPHEELGVIDVKSLGLSLKPDYGKLILEARQRAAQMGADAIIVTRHPVETTTTNGSATPRRKNKGGGAYVESTSTSETARISVVAISWKR